MVVTTDIICLLACSLACYIRPKTERQEHGVIWVTTPECLAAPTRAREVSTKVWDEPKILLAAGVGFEPESY